MQEYLIAITLQQILTTYIYQYNYDQYSITKQIMNKECQDSKIDSRGKDLLDLCISQKMRILKGRIFGSSFGNLTYFTPSGMDYVVESENFYDHILYFCVHNINPTLSDFHCLLQ